MYSWSKIKRLPPWKQWIIVTATVYTTYKIYKYCTKKRKPPQKEYYPDVTHLKASKIVDCKTELGECVLWDDRKGLLCWIDNLGKKFWTYNPETKQSKSYNLPECPGSFCFSEDGSLLFTFANGPAFYDIDTQIMSKRLWKFEPNTYTVPNDGRVDRNGRFVFGGRTNFKFSASGYILPTLYLIYNYWLFFIKKDASKIYRINKDLSYQIILNKRILCANSICFTLNGKTMYYTDTVGEDAQIRQLSYYADNKIPDNDRLFTKNVTAPDGSIVDSEDYVWSAHCGIGKVARINKEGEVDMIIDVDDKYVTCATIGGKDLDTVYITTLGAMKGCEDGNSGGLYAVKVANIKGCNENRFGGRPSQLK